MAIREIALGDYYSDMLAWARLQLSKSIPTGFGGIDSSLAQSIPLLTAGRSTGRVLALVDTVSAAGDATETSLSSLSTLGSRTKPRQISIQHVILRGGKPYIRSEPLMP